MSRWHTANFKAAKARRRRVYEEAFAFHEARVEKLSKAGRVDKLRNSGFILRGAHKQRIEARWPSAQRKP